MGARQGVRLDIYPYLHHSCLGHAPLEALYLTIDGSARIARVELGSGGLRQDAPLQKGFANLSAAQAQVVQLGIDWLAAWPNSPTELDRLPLAPAASDFQQRLRSALVATQPGQTLTYSRLASALATAPRAVGAGCRANPLPLLVPCHRVVAAQGRGGYCGGSSAGEWAALKGWLLEAEQATAKPRD
ncbi:methylated-DNA--protein-cysteine methyltransferase [Halorhodospira halochloris]|uniref:Methylated-DNA--protein-cysteine methyltransferase n=1 Tax=Halorhodospira halochloris TaxID=1052 RepID=A0A0X8X8B6_HALHR|nr:methylated-DNA--[protein]-cysteine S-methyltransferase [Halorhodospira halochloris]MBK1652855.1 hypothetical protein [Halorhodospira halochloris]BAU57334.1 methylated-DNA--protein-cysteine methyltransferase [Halorhodospira halochloris]